MIKTILLFSIRSYWRLVPKSRRRKCLFKTSCSHYVYEQIKKKGVQAGLRAMHFRIRNCNANYQIVEVNGEKLLITKTNKVFSEKEMSEFILNK